MKKVISVREIMIVIISVLLITFASEVFATDLVLGGDNNNNATVITGKEYDNATTIPDNTANNTTNDNTTNNTNNTTNNTVNTSNNKVNNTNNTKVYNTNNTSDLPQTGIEDYNIGILLIICVASAIFAYKKINDYKNI